MLEKGGADFGTGLNKGTFGGHVLTGIEALKEVPNFDTKALSEQGQHHPNSAFGSE